MASESPPDAPTIELADTADGEDSAPLPPSQVAARYEEMEEKAPKPIVLEDDEAPLPPSQIAEAAIEPKHDYDTRSKLEVVEDDGAPRPSSYIADALFGRDAAFHRKCAAVPPSSSARNERVDPPAEPSVDPPSQGNIDGSSLPPGETPSSFPFENASAGTEPMVELEAQLVQSVGATLIPPSNDSQVVHGVRVKPWWRRRQTFMFGGVGLLVGIGVAVAIALTVGSKDSTIEQVPVPVQSTVHPSISSVPSPSPSMFPTFQLSALELVNEVLKTTKIPFTDGEASGNGYMTTFTDVECHDLGVRDIVLTHSILNSTAQRVRVSASGVEMECSFQWSASWFILGFEMKERGTATGTLQPTSSMSTDVFFLSEDFNEYPPHEVDFGNCVTDFDVDLDIEDDGPGLVAAILETLYDLLADNALEKQMKVYFCDVLRKTDNETGLFDDALAVVSNSIDTLLDGNLPDDVDDPLQAEINAPVPTNDDGDPLWVNLLQQEDTEMLEAELIQVVEQLMDSASSKSPELEDENQGEPGFIISPPLNEIANDDPTLIGLFGLSLSVTSISVDWPGATKETKMLEAVGEYTLRSGLKLEYLPMEARMTLAIEPEIENNSLYFQETFAVKLNITAVDIEFALFLGTNAQNDGNDTLGQVFDPPCISSNVDEVKFTVLSVAVSNMTLPSFSGFLDPGLERVISSGGEAMFHMYEQSLLDALPGYLGLTLGRMMDNFVDEALNKTEAQCPTPDGLRVDEQVPVEEVSSSSSQRTVIGTSLVLQLFFFLTRA